MQVSIKSKIIWFAREWDVFTVYPVHPVIIIKSLEQQKAETETCDVFSSVMKVVILEGPVSTQMSFIVQYLTILHESTDLVGLDWLMSRVMLKLKRNQMQSFA